MSTNNICYLIHNLLALAYGSEVRSWPQSPWLGLGLGLDLKPFGLGLSLGIVMAGLVNIPGCHNTLQKSKAEAPHRFRTEQLL